MMSFRSFASLVAVGLIFTGCDSATGAIRTAKAYFNPLMGEWREVTTENKSQTLSVLFRPNQTFEFRTTSHAPEPRSRADEFLKLFGASTGTYSQGDSVIVFDIDEEDLMKRFAAAQRALGDTTEMFDLSGVNGSLDIVLHYKLTGDVLELTEEPTASRPARGTTRYVRLKR